MATEPRSTTAPCVDGELMPQRQVLEDEISAGADRLRRVLRQADGGRAQTSLSWLADTLLSQHRTVNRAFRDWTPYPVILVELDEQRGQPTADRSLRIASNCIDADGNPEQEKNIGIGKRVETARSRSTHRRGGYRRGGRDLAECKADPSWAASITSTSGPRDILPPHGVPLPLAHSSPPSPAPAQIL